MFRHDLWFFRLESARFFRDKHHRLELSPWSFYLPFTRASGVINTQVAKKLNEGTFRFQALAGNAMKLGTIGQTVRMEGSHLPFADPALGVVRREVANVGARQHQSRDSLHRISIDGL